MSLRLSLRLSLIHEGVAMATDLWREAVRLLDGAAIPLCALGAQIAKYWTLDRMHRREVELKRARRKRAKQPEQGTKGNKGKPRH